jgi:hypothetical protein
VGSSPDREYGKTMQHTVAKKIDLICIDGESNEKLFIKNIKLKKIFGRKLSPRRLER